MIDLVKLLKVPHVDPDKGFDISPDGMRVAFSWNPTGRWEIYEMPISGSNPHRQVTNGEGSKFAPKYAPDGTQLAYGLDLYGGEEFHIILHDLATGGHTDLTPDVDYAILPDFDWSPDGKEIAIITNRTGCFNTYVLPIRGGPIQLVLDNGYPACAVRWSPDGRWLAVEVELERQDHGIFIVPAHGGEAIQIIDERGGKKAHDPCWSLDSTSLVFWGSPRELINDICMYSVTAKSSQMLHDGRSEKTHPEWSPDGKKIAYIACRGADTWLAVQERGYLPEKYQVEAGVHYQPRFTPDGRHLILVYENPRHPPDLWVFELEGGTFRQLTNSLPGDMAGHAFVIPEQIMYPGMDVHDIPAVLYTPSEVNQDTPAVVNIHGGPDWHYQFCWNPFITHLASRGWTVLAPNYRGSTGFGPGWQNENRYDLGGVDTCDVAAGVMYLVQQGLANPKRIAVTGRSHGGYLTMTCLTQYPDLWAAGSAVVPFLNWFTAHANSRSDQQHWDLENMGDPKKNHDLWYKHSPYFFLDSVRAPVQFICGEHDPRCPASESIEARDKLLSLGKEVDFTLYKDEGHSFLKIENVIDSEVRRLDFLVKALER